MGWRRAAWMSALIVLAAHVPTVPASAERPPAIAPSVHDYLAVLGTATVAPPDAGAQGAIERLLDRLDDATVAVATALSHDPPDAAALEQARLELFASAMAELPHILMGAPQPVDVCGVVLVSVGDTADHHTCDYRLAIDLGGDDRWSNNAGGTGRGLRTCTTASAALFAEPPSVALAIDIGGDDLYDGEGLRAGIAGGACNGLGILIDLDGDDVYAPRATGEGALTGAGVFGAGLLVDGSGDDVYHGEVRSGGGGGGSGGVNGGSNFGGQGLLIDRAGNDTYWGRVDGLGGANGGANDGSGFLYDASGHDRYDGFVRLAGGLNGGSSFGRGTLIDGAGDDIYRGAISTADRLDAWLGLPLGAPPHGGINGGATASSHGTLIDRAGNDSYDGVIWGIGGLNGGGDDAHGGLFDMAGDDIYQGAIHLDGAINGGAVAEGTGRLVDLAGDDVYSGWLGGAGGINGGAVFGSGLLHDHAGDDSYMGHAPLETCSGGDFPTRPCVAWVNGGAQAGIGLLIDGGGADTYDDGSGPDPDLTVVPKGLAGAQLDLPVI